MPNHYETPRKEQSFESLAQTLLATVEDAAEWHDPINMDARNWVNANGYVGIHEILDILTSYGVDVSVGAKR